MSELDDPRVLFAAERTLLAWSRTAAGLMALGFFVDRASLVDAAGGPHRKFAAWIGVAFLLLGVVLSILSVVQYRRSVASLRQVEIPPGYWLNLGVGTSLAVALLGVLLVLYILQSV
jgi:putative membrane protein